MTQLYIEALAGTLQSPPPGTALPKMTITNALPCSLNIYWIDTSGQRVFQSPAPINGGAVTIADACVGYYYVLTSYLSGVFVCAIQLQTGQKPITIDGNWLTGAGDIGPLPTPSASILVPQDSPRVMVACADITRPAKTGKASPWRCMSREQYWKRTLDSYVLAPGQKLSISYTNKTGMQEMTSTQEVFATSMGLNTNAGWGAVSAGLSVNINSTSTALQQITLTTQTSRFDAMEVENKTADSQMFLRWQLFDIIQVFDPTLPYWQAVLAAAISAEAPALVDGPYVFKASGPVKA